MKIFENQWKSMKIYVDRWNQWGSMKIYVNQWKPMKSLEIKWKCLNINKIGLKGSLVIDFGFLDRCRVNFKWFLVDFEILFWIFCYTCWLDLEWNLNDFRMICPWALWPHVFWFIQEQYTTMGSQLCSCNISIVYPSNMTRGVVIQ